MKSPSIGQTEGYYISDTEVALVKLEDNRFWVSIRNREGFLPGEKFRITVSSSNNISFDKFEQVKEYLLEKADEAYKLQFQD